MDGLEPEVRDKLLAAARAALPRAHAPYSQFRVGAAVLTAAGSVYTGCNVENASYGLSCCAERVAIFAAVAGEGPDIRLRAVAVTSDPDLPAAPCGACRQVIGEFGAATQVVYRSREGIVVVPIADLLPDAFTFDPGGQQPTA
jgi:cytidine deaminase